MKLSFENNSWIKRVEYDTENKEMVVYTLSKSFACPNVPQEVYEAFDRSPSRGTFFNENIKGNYVDKWFK